MTFGSCLVGAFPGGPRAFVGATSTDEEPEGVTRSDLVLLEVGGVEDGFC